MISRDAPCAVRRSFRGFDLQTLGPAAVIILMLGASPALAQDASPSTDTEAHALFDAGHTAFEDGRFADALTDFERAYELSHRPELLYNIGQCHDHLRHDAEAVSALEGYLAAVPDAPARHMIEGRLAILREAVAHDVAAQPPIENEPTPVTTAPASSDATTPAPQTSASGPTAGWVLVGVGAGVAVIGAVLVGVAFADIGNVEGATGVPYSTVRDANERAPIESGVGWAALGVGVAAAAVGLVLAVTSGSMPADARASLRVGPAGLVLEGCF